MSKILSFDTSNYTTSACIFDTKYGIVWENRIMLPVTTGKCGLRQSEAVFLHNRNLSTLFNDVSQFKIDYVAASCCPSERTDSYMPCFTVGTSFASALSKLLGVPLYMCSHQKNHIGAALYSGGCTQLLKGDFFAYHISGGTTDVLLCKSTSNYLQISKIGGTADISCGQMIDRAGVALGLPFPCGKHLQEKADGNLNGKIKIAKNNFYYNFSGFENKTKDMINSGTDIKDIADYIFNVVYSFIVDSLENNRKMYENLPAVFSGGVMSNLYINKSVNENLDNVYFADSEYSSDHAVGTAFMCAFERGLLNE